MDALDESSDIHGKNFEDILNLIISRVGIHADNDAVYKMLVQDHPLLLLDYLRQEPNYRVADANLLNTINEQIEDEKETLKSGRYSAIGATRLDNFRTLRSYILQRSPIEKEEESDEKEAESEETDSERSESETEEENE